MNVELTEAEMVVIRIALDIAALRATDAEAKKQMYELSDKFLVKKRK